MIVLARAILVAPLGAAAAQTGAAASGALRAAPAPASAPVSLRGPAMFRLAGEAAGGKRFPEAREHGRDRRLASDSTSTGASIWEVFGAALMVTMTAIIGIVFIPISTMQCVNTKTLMEGMRYFAAGAILSTDLIILIPEVIQTLEKVGGADYCYLLGTFALVGFTCCVATHYLLGHSHGHSHDETTCEAVGKGARHVGADSDSTAPSPKVAPEIAPGDRLTTAKKLSVRQIMANMPPIAYNVLIGDSLHNFSDGVMLGAAFQSSRTFGWIVTTVGVLHELPQELSDFFILLDRAGFKPFWALFWNTVTALPCIVGAMLTFCIDIPIVVVGSILAYGAGVFLFVACVELMPDMIAVEGSRSKIRAMFFFALGAVVVGLVKLIPGGSCCAHP